jgi:hypothetical protein
MAEHEIVWTGEENRPLTLQRPCTCGCDDRDGHKGVGYLTGSDEDGRGFSLWIESEALYQRLERTLGAVA